VAGALVAGPVAAVAPADAAPEARPTAGADRVAGPGPASDPMDLPVPPDYDAPLLITIDTLTPGALGDGGGVRVTGEIANRDVVPWEGISIYPMFNPEAPMTTEAELEEAAGTEPEAVVGERITEVSDSVEELLPGEVASYSIRVPRDYLQATTPGVYWFGVHALGASETTPDDGFADGRARTFLPYVPDATHGAVDTAIVVPLRRRIVHTSGGAIARRESWENALDDQGNLGRLLGFAGASFGRPLSWLVDPALPDALRRLARGNPPRSLGPTTARPGEGESGAGDPDDPDASFSEAPDTGGGEESGSDEQPVDAMAAAAQGWLADLAGQVRGEEVLALPYGDLDVAGAAAHLPGLYDLARRPTGQQLSEWGVAPVPVVGSPTGYLDPAGFGEVDDDAIVLATDRMWGAELHPDGPPRVGEYAGAPVAVTSYAATLGGPGPDPRLAPVAFRQRVLSEAAVRLVADGPAAPLVVMVPPRIDPEGAEEFWSGLDADWLRLTTVEKVVDRNRRAVDPSTLTYPEEQASLALGASVFAELEALLAAGETLQNVLTDNDRVATEVLEEALSSVSYSARTAPFAAVEQLSRSRQWIEDRLDSVRISAPLGVTLSSADGSVPVTVVNRLRVPVTVMIRAESEEGLQVDVGDPVRLGPDSRTTVVLDAHTTGLGVRNVTFSLTDTEGTPLGATDRVPVRSNQVSDVIWWVLGTGAGILFLAIAVRLVRRVRAARRGQDGSEEAVTAATADPSPAGQTERV